MISLDSVKLKYSYEELDINKNKFIQDSQIDSDGNVLKNIYKNRDELPFGFKSISIDPVFRNVILEFSAKILKDDYLSGINNSTLDRLIYELQKNECVGISSDNIEGSEILRCDVTTNLYVDEPRKSINSLKLGKSNVGFIVSDFDTVKNNGIVFQGRQLSYKNRQIYYNKFVELGLKSNIPFVTEFPNLKKESKNIVRVEQNLSSFKYMKKSLLLPKYENPKFIDVLNSKANPLYKRHLDIMQYAFEVTLFDEYSPNDYKIQRVIDVIGYEGIFEKCNKSMELSIDYLKKFITGDGRNNKSTVYKIIKDFKIYMSNKLGQTSNEQSINNVYFQELNRISNLLKVA